MSRNKFVVLLIIILMITGVILTIKGGNLPRSQNKKEKAVYYCPMHPTYISDKPGDCPICYMKLVKKEDSNPVPAKEQMVQRMKDICIMHNCPKKHEGKICPMLMVTEEGEKVTCPICGMHVVGETAALKEKRILYWTDPMISGYKSEKPGKSPMGMDLIPVYEEEGVTQSQGSTPEGYASVVLSTQKQQLIGIKTAKIEKKRLNKTIRTVGTIAHDPELYQAQSEYIQAIKAYQQAQASSIPEIVDQSKRLLESTRIRLKHLGLSDDLIEEIATWKEPEHSLLFAHPGDPVWMYAQIYEFELPLIKVGQEVDAGIPSLPGEVFKGKIRAIDRMVEPTTRTTRIRVLIEDLKGHLKPDMYVNVTLNIDLGETLTVPVEAVFNTGTRQIVFLDEGQGIFTPRDVVLGTKTENDYEVKEGLKEQESVVVSGNFLIDSESRLKSAIE